MTIGGIVALYGVLVISFAVAIRPSRLQRDVDRAAGRAGLGVPTQLRPLLLRRVRATRIGEMAGAAVGLAVPFGILHRASNSVVWWTFTVQPLLIAFAGIGAAIGGLVAAQLTFPAGPRVARERVLRVADYIDPVERFTVLAAAALVTAVGLLPVALRAVGPRTLPAVAVGLTAFGVWLGFELVARRIVARPERAGSAAHLAWNDAIRSAAIRRLAAVTAVMSSFGLLLVVLIEAEALLPRDAAQLLEWSVLFGVVFSCIAARAWVWLRLPGRYFRDRLWPDAVPFQAEQQPVTS